MEIYDLTEYKPLLIAGYRPDEEERLYLQEMAGIETKPRFIWRELRSGLEFSFTSWVGVIQLKRAMINIRPKFDPNFRDLLNMLTYARGNDHFISSRETRYLRGPHLLEIIIEMLCNEIDTLLQLGLCKEYIHLEEDLTVFRGRPDMRRQLVVNRLLPTRLACCFDELVTDIPENRIIRTALEQARWLPLSSSLSLQVRLHLGLFLVVCEPHFGPFPEAFHYNRLNEHYRGCHELCRLLLEQAGAGELFIKEEKGLFTLLIDMNVLFERFIARLIGENLPSGWRMTSQHREVKAIICESGLSYRHIIPDLLLIDPEGRRLVIDSKYKLYGQCKVNNSDIYQLAFYAQAFEVMNERVYKACIIYPVDATGGETVETLWLNKHSDRYCGELKVVGVNLSEALQAIGRKDRNYLGRMVARFLGD